MYVDHIENDILSNMLSTSHKDVVIFFQIMNIFSPYVFEPFGN